MGLFDFFKSRDEDEEEEEQVIQSSLVDKLVDLGIDFRNYTHTGKPMELTIDDELRRIVKKTFLVIENNFFTTSIYFDFKNGKHQLFLSKDEPTERDFKDFIDKAFNVLGRDSGVSGEFTLSDLERIRGCYNPFEGDYRTELRGWKDTASGYYIRIGFIEDDKSLYVNIF